MRGTKALSAGVLLLVIAPAAPALAHAPLMSCFQNEDRTVTCEAGYSDGASAAGQVVQLADVDGRLLVEAVFGDDGTYTFTPPEGLALYTIEFIGDAAHNVLLFSDEIVPFA
ncbi:MAG: hypothetical protein AB7O56_13445 [Bauldia sp.]